MFKRPLWIALRYRVERTIVQLVWWVLQMVCKQARKKESKKKSLASSRQCWVSSDCVAFRLAIAWLPIHPHGDRSVCLYSYVHRVCWKSLQSSLSQRTICQWRVQKGHPEAISWVCFIWAPWGDSYTKSSANTPMKVVASMEKSLIEFIKNDYKEKGMNYYIKQV